MPLLYQPKPASIVVCDFRGFIVPEMVKVRPVVVLAKHKHNAQLVTVIPLSTTAPAIVQAHHHELCACPLPDQPPYTRVWAKCDMIYTVALGRLDRYRFRTADGRQYAVPSVSQADFEGIKAAVRVALAM